MMKSINSAEMTAIFDIHNIPTIIPPIQCLTFVSGNSPFAR